MKVVKKQLIVLVFLSILVGGGGCGALYSDYGYGSSGGPGTTDLMLLNQNQQMIDMQRNQQNFDNLNTTLDRMRNTTSRFGSTINSANRMRRQNSR